MQVHSLFVGKSHVLKFLKIALNSSTIDELGEGAWKDRGAQ